MNARQVAMARRWPLEPLLELLGIDQDHQYWRARVAVFVPYNVRTVLRWATEGLTDEAADRVAIHLGLQPFVIWPDWTDVIDLEQVAC